MTEENKELIYNGNCVLIGAGCRAKVKENERPMTREERLELLLNH